MMKMRKDTTSTKNRALSTEEFDFHLLMALAIHGLPRKKSDQLVSSLEAIANQDKFHAGKNYT